MRFNRLSRVRAMAAGASIALHAAAVATALTLARMPAPEEHPAIVQVVVVQTAPLTHRTEIASGEGRPAHVATRLQPSAPAPAATARATQTSGLPSSSVQAIDKGQIFDLYAAEVWRRLAAHRPRGVRGAAVARVRFALDIDGAVRSAQIVASSGSALFDRACLDAVYAAAPYPTPPSALTADDLVFEAPIASPR